MKRGIETHTGYDPQGRWMLCIEKARGKFTLDEIIEAAKEWEEDIYALVLKCLDGEWEETQGDYVEPDNGWISVKDRLPDDKERYLICTEGGRIDIAYYQPTGDKFSDYEPFWQGSCRFTAEVTHWQPLPEPPKGE